MHVDEVIVYYDSDKQLYKAINKADESIFEYGETIDIAKAKCLARSIPDKEGWDMEL